MNPPVSPLTLFAVALVSFVVALPFAAKDPARLQSFALELELKSDTAGYSQVYFDLGGGFSEPNSSRVGISATPSPAVVRFKLPIGTIVALRFDPLDRPAQVSFAQARIVSSQGETIASLPAAAFAPQQHISSFHHEGQGVRLSIDQSATDPILSIDLPRPLTLTPQGITPLALAKPAVGVFLLIVGVGLVFRAATRKGVSRRAWLERLRVYAGQHPQKSVALSAVLVTGMAVYPVLFLGKSFVSPSYSDGTYLLYGEFPTLPGQKLSQLEDARGADVGPIAWSHVPYSLVQSEALLHHRELPLWNRYNSAGVPLVGQGQSMFGDPLHLLPLLSGGAAWAWDAKYVIARWLLCCGLGLTVLHATRHLPAGLLATLSAGFMGFFVYRLNHPAYFSFCYAPWILFAWLRLARATGFREAATWGSLLIVANTAEMHSGTVKEAYVLLLGMNLCGAAVLACGARPFRHKLAALGTAVWANACFVLLTAPTWLTFLSTLKRAWTAYDQPQAFQIQPAVALGLFDEIFYRPLTQDERVFNPSANFLVLAGVLYVFVASRDVFASRTARAVAGIAAVFAAFAFGVVPPQWIVQIPFLGKIAHIDNTFSCALLVCLVVLAGFGWKAACDRLGTPRGREDIARFSVAYALLVAAWLAFTQVVHRPIYGPGTVVTVLDWGQRLPVSAMVWTSLLVLTLALLALLVFARRALLQRRWDAAALLLVGASLAAMLWRHGTHTPQVGPPAYVFSPGDRVDLQAPSRAIAALKRDQTEPGRVVGFDANLFPGWTGAYSLEGPSGPDALANPYYQELLQGLGCERAGDWRLVLHAHTFAQHRPALDFLNVRHYVALRGGEVGSAAGLTAVAREDLDVIRSETAWPRAFFVTQVRPYDSAAELGALVRSTKTGPFAAVQRSDLAQHPALQERVADQTPAPARAAAGYRIGTNSTRFTIEASGPGLAVLQEAWLDGDFLARVDGHPASIFRVNHAFKGVAVPTAGVHEIEFTYRPRLWTASLVLTATGTLLWLMMVALAWQKRGGSPQRSTAGEAASIRI